jgi:hypothetical protein
LIFAVRGNFDRQRGTVTEEIGALGSPTLEDPVIKARTLQPTNTSAVVCHAHHFQKTQSLLMCVGAVNLEYPRQFYSPRPTSY